MTQTPTEKYAYAQKWRAKNRKKWLAIKRKSAAKNSWKKLCAKNGNNTMWVREGYCRICGIKQSESNLSACKIKNCPK